MADKRSKPIDIPPKRKDYSSKDDLFPLTGHPPSPKGRWMRLRNRAVTTTSSPTSLSPSPSLSFSKQPVPLRPRVGVSLITRALHPERFLPTLPQDQEPAAMPTIEEGDNEVGAKDEAKGGVKVEAKGEAQGEEQNDKLAAATEGEYATDAPSAPEEVKAEPQAQPQAQATSPPSNDQASPPTAPASSAPEIEPTPAQAEPEISTPVAPQRTHAVRGDRSATGGPAHKKLTDEELTEKLEKMKIINAKKAERFRLSEADSAAFAQKEKEMAQKRAAEQRATRHQDMERAKNRQRKLQAQGGREWDSEKLESDIVDGRGRGRSSQYVRGGHGGVIRGDFAGSRSTGAAQDEASAGNPSRGRGGFEIRGRGNRGGRGGRAEPAATKIPTAEDFPSLPTPANPPNPPTISPPVVDVKSPLDKGPVNWADEMETPVDNKNISV